MANKNAGIYNAPKELGWPKTIVLGFQHVFAMFGATVVVPIITGLNVQTTLFCAGIGTLFFHLVTQRKAPVFLGSSFAFLGGFAAVKALPLTDAAGNALTEAEKLPYACCSGSADPHLRHQADYAVLPAGCHWSDYHSHWPDSCPECC